MKQVVQNYKTGDLKVMEVPVPQVRPSAVLVRTLFSAISAGTEKTKVDTARKSLLDKARSRPDLVKKVLEKVKKEGFWSTYEMVQKKLSEPVPLGYSCVGVVEELGEWVEGVQVGDIVACAGAGSANHAEYNVVPGRLVAKASKEVPLEQAAFTTIGSIALQGVRQAEPKIGERIVVLGMGLIGQITAQILRANGCSVFAVDLDPWKLDRAKSFVSETALGSDPKLLERIFDWSKGRGADAVILTASTPSSGPIEQAGQMCRDKGRVVIVGAVGTTFPREPYYMKELDIRIARSYGPGRYDPMYEELGIDYPVGFVRFTEQRNMETFLDLLATGAVDLRPLLTHQFAIHEAGKAFDLLGAEKPEPYLGIVLDYRKEGDGARETSSRLGRAQPQSQPQADRTSTKPLDLGFIGLGNYATSQLLPKLKGISGIRLQELSTASGMTAAIKGPQYGFQKVQDRPSDLIHSPSVGTVFITTRHDSHAQFVIEGLTAGKNVFVEKPLCLYPEELEKIRGAYEGSTGILTVGFNRRFSPLVQELKQAFPTGAKHIVYRVNAGKLPAEHWLKVPEIGGGRILGEGCHFVDLASYLAHSPVSSVHAIAVSAGAARSPAQAEDVHITLGMENGSVATVVYLSEGSSKLPKEFIEVHGGGSSGQIDDFTSLTLNGTTKKSGSQNKGQAGMLKAFVSTCESGKREASPIPAEALWNCTHACFAVIESLSTGKTVYLGSNHPG